MKEFTAVLRRVNADVQEADIAKTFDEIGAKDGEIDVVGLAKWLALTFKDLSAEEFDEGMQKFVPAQLAEGATESKRLRSTC